MAKRELIYKDEARRAVLQNAPGIAWSVDNIKPAMIVDDEPVRPTPEIDEYWIARIQYWPEQDLIVDIVIIYYAWENGEIDFIPCVGGGGGDPVCSTQCARFELLEKVEVDKYK